MSTLTGIKDIDLQIIQKLNDNELTKVCSVNKYINSLCDEEKFWLERILINFKILNSQESKKMKLFLAFSYKELYKFLKTFPIVLKNVAFPEELLTREEIITILKKENVINQIIEKSLRESLPKWVNKQELIYDLRRNMPLFLIQRKFANHMDTNPIYRYLQMAISNDEKNNFPRIYLF
jgi:hypothetical protein